MANRQVKKVEGYHAMWRIMKSHDGKKIHVYQHNYDHYRSDYIREVAGDYEIEGFLKEEYPTTGSWRYTLKEVVESYEKYHGKEAA